MEYVRFALLAVMIAVGCSACLGGGRATSVPPKHTTGGTTRPVAPPRAKPVLVSIPPVTGRWPLDPPPPIASAPVRLVAPPPVVVDACQAEQSKTTMVVLCPTLVPLPTLPGVRGGKVGNWETVLYPGGSGYEINYAAPWELGSGRGWRGHLWRNRPCCFFHFTIEWWTGRVGPTEGAYFAIPPRTLPEYRATIGGYHGHEYNATIADHLVFLFSRDGAKYDVTEHSFGPGTQALLSRIVRGLRPLNSQ
jgi:hypothetical protein